MLKPRWCLNPGLYGSLRTTFKWCSIDCSYSPRPPPPSSEPSPAAALFPSFIAHGGAVRVDGSRRAVVRTRANGKRSRASIVRTHLGRHRPCPPRTLPAEASPLPSFSCASGVVRARLSSLRLRSRVGGGVLLRVFGSRRIDWTSHLRRGCRAETNSSAEFFALHVFYTRLRSP